MKHTDKHYDFVYKLTEKDIAKGEIKIDPYFVASEWKLSEKDNGSCILFHILKTLTRFGKKEGNDAKREIDAIISQANNLKRFIDDEDNTQIKGIKKNITWCDEWTQAFQDYARRQDERMDKYYKLHLGIDSRGDLIGYYKGDVLFRVSASSGVIYCNNKIYLKWVNANAPISEAPLLWKGETYLLFKWGKYASLHNSKYSILSFTNLRSGEYVEDKNLQIDSYGQVVIRRF